MKPRGKYIFWLALAFKSLFRQMGSGVLLMNKPNFKEMSKSELIAYIKQNRTDDQAIRELFVNRRNPNATWYPAPLDPESIRITEEAIRNRVQEEDMSV
jgi:hypothetical protein